VETANFSNRKKRVDSNLEQAVTTLTQLQVDARSRIEQPNRVKLGRRRSILPCWLCVCAWLWLVSGVGVWCVVGVGLVAAGCWLPGWLLWLGTVAAVTGHWPLATGH